MIKVYIKIFDDNYYYFFYNWCYFFKIISKLLWRTTSRTEWLYFWFQWCCLWFVRDLHLFPRILTSRFTKHHMSGLGLDEETTVCLWVWINFVQFHRQNLYVKIMWILHKTLFSNEFYMKIPCEIHVKWDSHAFQTWWFCLCCFSLHTDP